MKAGTADHPLRAAFAILGAALSFSLSPAIIHLTAADSNPFYFNLAYVITQTVLLIGFLAVTKDAYLHALIPRNELRQAGFGLWFSHLRRVSGDDSEYRVSLSTASIHSPRSWVRAPIVWIIVASLQFAFFAWAAQYTATAIVAMIFELWPAVVVFGLARHELTDRLYRDPLKIDPHKRKPLTEQMILTALSAIGLLFMLGSQAGDAISSILDLFSYNGTIGMTLALIAAVVGSLDVLGSLALGEASFYRLVDKRRPGATHPMKNPRDRDSPNDSAGANRTLLLWLSLCATVVGRLVGLPLFVVIGILTWDLSMGVSMRATLGGVALAAVLVAGHILLRLGNVSSGHPGVNALFFLSPLMALLWLMALGISLPRFDLFLIGAALIITINILIQVKPEEGQQDYTTGRVSRRGFTAFILSIWLFGTILYMRDELFPSSWLTWSSGDYWTMVALSATIFALILGFRVARLTARITREDEAILEIFYDCVRLVRRNVLPDSVVAAVSRLDTAHPRELPTAYEDLQNHIDRAKSNDNENSLLLSVELRLAMIVHSKQQGRDIVELLSLVAFALVTIGLGLLSRPEVTTSSGAWSGFLSEVFVLLFASTIAFLCVNLFDIRRERESPLMVRLDQRDGSGEGHRLFFRFQGDQIWRNVAAVLISLAMSVVFCILLYGKWLQSVV